MRASTLMAGFTTVRNVGAEDFADVALRDAINDADVIGPRMQVSGPIISITGGHGDMRSASPSSFIIRRTAWRTECRQ